MSLKIVNDQLEKFLKNDAPEVIAIKGSWGVGKTYTWNKIILDLSKRKEIKNTKYSYVSVFGLNSTKELKSAIFENTIDTELIGELPNIASFKRNTSKIIEQFSRKSVKWLSQLKFIEGYASIIESITFLSLYRTIICIDDIERKGRNLELADILGIISLLKEQKLCKIVVLMNSEEAQDETYLKYKEKVFDKEIEFSPTPGKECASIAIDSDSTFAVHLKKYVMMIGITNIRIIKKAEYLLYDATQYLNCFEPELLEQITQTTVLFTYCYFNKSGGTPPFDYIYESNFDSLMLREDKMSDEERQWNLLLREYNYDSTDDLDRCIADAVKSGFFDKERISLELSSSDKKIKMKKAANSFHEAWRMFHDSFNNNMDEVLEKLYVTFKENAENIELNNLNGTIKLFRELKQPKKATELLEHYIEINRDNIELFDLSKLDVFNEIDDDEIIEKFNHTYEKKHKEASIYDICERILDNQIWDHSDILSINKASVDELIELLKSYTGVKMRRIINFLLKIGASENSDETSKNITENTVQALKRIGAESLINERRVRRYGISIEE